MVKRKLKFNKAIILPEIGPLDFEFMGMTRLIGSDIKELYPDGNIVRYLPANEIQVGIYFDTYGCVSFSFLNGVEVGIDRKYNEFSLNNQNWLRFNVYKDGRPNFSDRDLVIMSDTNPDFGNSGNKVLEAAQKHWLVAEKLAPWNFREWDPKINNKVRYYAYGRNEISQAKAEELNSRFEIIGEWVYRSEWEQASKEGVLQVYVNAWFKDKNGIYFNPDGDYNHAVIMCDYKGVRIYDHYEPFIKTLRSWEDVHYIALKINIIEKVMEKPKIENNTLVQLIDSGPGGGQFGLHLDNKILTGEEGKIALSFYMRNNGDTKGKTMALNREQWDMFEKKNL